MRLSIPAALVLALATVVVPAASARADATGPSMPDRAPVGLSYLAQSVDQYRTAAGGDRLSVTLVWSKPANYRQFSDYAIFEQAGDGPLRAIGLASRNSASPAQHAFDVFYRDPANRDAVRAVTHNYIATDLRPSTGYRFEVRGVTRDGARVTLGAPYEITMSTPAPAQQFVVTADGHTGVPSAADGGALQYTQAIQAAINAAAQVGGEVVIPAGVRLLSGALYLASGVTLRVDGTLAESRDLSLVTPATGFTPSNGTKYLPLINIAGTSAHRLQNVRIVGTGTIDGQGWQYRDDAPDVTYARQLGLTQSKTSTYATVGQNGLIAAEIYNSCVAAGGAAGNSTCYGKRSNLIGGTQVDNMYIGDGLRIQNPSNSLTGFSYVSNYVVNGIVAQSFNSNNGDAVNVSRFSGFTALNNVVNSGDDDIVMNAGGSTEAPVGSAWVFDNYLARGHGGVAFGSGTASWIDNVLIEDDVFVGTSNGVRAKSKPGSGGGVRYVTARDLAMKDLTNKVDGKIDPLVIGYQMDGSAFIFTTHYPGDYQSVAWPVFHDWNVSHVSVDGTDTAGIIVDGLHDQGKLDELGLPFQPSYHLTFSDMSFRNAGIPRLDYLTDSSFTNVTFRDPHGALIRDPWLDVAGLDGVPLPGSPLPLDARAQRRGEDLTVVSDGSFDRFYPETLPDDVRLRAGSILVDGVALADSAYPSFQPKADGGGLVAGTDGTVLIGPRYETNVGSVFTFRKAFLNTLTPGEHTFSFVFTNGTASTTVRVR